MPLGMKYQGRPNNNNNNNNGNSNNKIYKYIKNSYNNIINNFSIQPSGTKVPRAIEKINNCHYFIKRLVHNLFIYLTNI